MVAAADRPFQGEYGKNVTIDQREKFLQFRQGECVEIATPFGREAHGLRDSFMRLPERSAFPDQVIRKVGSSRVPTRGRGSHCFLVNLYTRHHVSENSQSVAQGIHRIEYRFLVFLIILVVCEWLGFHEREQRDKMSIDTARFPSNQFWNVRVFLLRHDG